MPLTNVYAYSRCETGEDVSRKIVLVTTKGAPQPGGLHSFFGSRTIQLSCTELLFAFDLERL